jgi:hypothetical protein
MRGLILALLLLAFPAHAAVLATTGGNIFYPVISLDYPSTFIFRSIYGNNFANNFGWNLAQVTDSTRYIAQGVSSPSRYANASVMVTVNAGDSNAGGERNEMLRMTANGIDTNSTYFGVTEYYAISVFMPTSWQDDDHSPPWAIVMQLHGADTNTGAAASPSIVLDLSTVAGHYTLTTRGGINGGSITVTNTDLGTHVLNQWVDFVFQVTYADDATGAINVWTRTNNSGLLAQNQVGTGTPISTITGPNTYSTSSNVLQNQYWKSGLYRGATNSFNSVVYLSPLTRAATMSGAAANSFGGYPLGSAPL